MFTSRSNMIAMQLLKPAMGAQAFGMQQMQSSAAMVTFPQRFIGKSETGHKFKTPKMRMRVIRSVPPPGLNFTWPKDLDVETFCKQIGGDCDDVADKFENIDEVFTLTRVNKSPTR